MDSTKTGKWHGIDGIVVSQLREDIEEALGADHLNETVDQIARHIRMVVGAHQSAVSFIPDGDFSRAIHGISLSEKYQKYASYDVMPTGEGIWSLIFERGEPMRLTEAEIHAHPRFLNFSNLKDERGLEHPPLPGWLAVPVMRRAGDAIGVLQLSDRFEGDFTDEDQTVLENAAMLIAPTMETEYFYEKVRLQQEELLLANEELNRFNKLFVGRESRIIDLKNEVNELCAKVGEQPRYDLKVTDDHTDAIS